MHCDSVPKQNIAGSKNVIFAATKTGGHIGFIKSG